MTQQFNDEIGEAKKRSDAARIIAETSLDTEETSYIGPIRFQSERLIPNERSSELNRQRNYW